MQVLVKIVFTKILTQSSFLRTGCVLKHFFMQQIHSFMYSHLLVLVMKTEQVLYLLSLPCYGRERYFVEND